MNASRQVSSSSFEFNHGLTDSSHSVTHLRGVQSFSAVLRTKKGMLQKVSLAAQLKQSPINSIRLSSRLFAFAFVTSSVAPASRSHHTARNSVTNKARSFSLSFSQSKTSRPFLSSRPFHSTALALEESRTMPSLPPFPVAGLLPKEATEAAKFLSKYPNYDGRKIRVGILDTGVDPAARGLDGKGKVVDIIDCTGTGDIPITPLKPTETTSDAVELISPVTGRKIIVDPAWTSQAQSADQDQPVWFHGFKPAFEVWPEDLTSRRKTQRKRNWDVETAKVVSQVQRELADLENGATPAASTQAPSQKNGNVNEDKAADPSAKSVTSTKVSDTKKEKDMQKEELKARLAVLSELQSSYADPGPLLETITFHDGKSWRTVVGGAEGDIRESTVGLAEDSVNKLQGQVLDLRKAKALADFRVEQQHDVFGPADLLSYSINHMFESANTSHPSGISLVTLSGSHGTHVAGITGAHLPDSPEENGVAPGVEIVSLKIGDTRVSGMETGQALLRAAQALISTNCDIANMSFGEDGAFGAEGKGAFAAALRDYVIRQKDILFVSSAGNSAPALTTLGQPAGTTEGVFTIGAYVTAGSMQDAEYALIERNVRDSPTTWSSRGPAADGGRGTTVYSPGAAITSIPKYCLSATQLMNGTSMASPNACGAISLLLSGMKQEGIPITAARVLKAVTATAKDFGDELEIGFIQVDKAWNYILDNKDRPDADFEYKVRVTPPGKPLAASNAGQRGVYLREKAETQRVGQFNVTVRPILKGTEPEKAYELQLKCNLKPSDNWVTAPEFLHLRGNGRTFEIRVDPTHLPPGLHTASVKGFDSDRPGHELFDVPITVTKPEVAAHATVRYSTTLKSGSIERNFLHVPEGATWAEVRFRSNDHGSPGTTAKFWAHFVALEPQRRLSAVEQAFVLALNENEPITKKFSVKGGQTLEVCLAEMWNAAQRFNIDVEFEFHGITIGHSVSGRDELTLIGGEGFAKIEATSNIRIESFTPTISFSKRRSYVRPSKSSIRPLLSDRNLQPSGKALHELVNTYNFTVSEAGQTTISLPTSSPHSNLYDSAVPMLTAIYEATTKKLVSFGDVYPKGKDLAKGSYIVKVQWLNEQASVLEKLKTATLRMTQGLTKGKDIALSLYEDHVDAFGSASPATFKGNVKLYPGEKKVLNLDLNLHGDALPKEAQPGDVLIGEFGFAAQGKYELRYIVAPATKPESSDDGDSKDDDKTNLAKLLAPVASKIKDKEDKAKFIKDLLEKYPTSLDVLQARLDSLDLDKASDASSVVEAADAILKQIDLNSILLFSGEKWLPASELSEEQKKKKKELEEEKKAIVKALIKKSKALLLQSESEQLPQDFLDTFESARKLLGESTDNKEWTEVRVQYLLRYRSQSDSSVERLAQALQLVRKTIKDLGVGEASNKEDLNKAREQQRAIVDRLNWKVWAAYLDRQRVLQSPQDFKPF
ncbi:unnamed protein product [Sympodiomycopsis kandeliae]